MVLVMKVRASIDIVALGLLLLLSFRSSAGMFMMADYQQKISLNTRRPTLFRRCQVS